MKELLEGAFKHGTTELTLCVALTTLQMTPSSRPLKIGIGEAIMLDALAEACGASVDELKDELRQRGDLGEVAAARLEGGSSATTSDNGVLTLREAHAALLELNSTIGKGSKERKVALMSDLPKRARPIEATYMVRSIRGTLRTGLGDRSVRAAIARAAASASADPSEALAAAATAVEEAEAKASAAEVAVSSVVGSEASSKKEIAAVEKEKRKADRELSAARKAYERLIEESRRRVVERVESAYRVRPCYHALIDAVSGGGRSVWELEETPDATVGVPLVPMAAAPAREVAEVLSRMSGDGEPFLIERKYDGERCQLHVLPAETSGGETEIRLFSRSLDEMTIRFPEMVTAVERALNSGDGGSSSVSSIVLDGELCAVDTSSGIPLPFAALASRPRKGPTSEQVAATPVCFYAFDVLYHNGKSTLSMPLGERRALLRNVMMPAPGSDGARLRRRRVRRCSD